MLTVVYGSTNTLAATLTNAAGAAVTGATVTVTIMDGATALVTAQSMTEAGSTGVYNYTIAYNLLTSPGASSYKAQVTAVSGSNRRYAEIQLLNAVDVD